MKRLMMMLALSGLVQLSFAQTDTTAKTNDTVKVGNFIIIKKIKTLSLLLMKKLTSILISTARTNQLKRSQVMLALTGSSSIWALPIW